MCRLGMLALLGGMLAPWDALWGRAGMGYTAVLRTSAGHALFRAANVASKNDVTSDHCVDSILRAYAI